MFVKVFRDDIIEGLAKSASIIPAKTGAAFLRTIWLRAVEGKLSVLSTDSNLEFNGSYTAQIVEEGLVGVQGRSFYDLIRKLPTGAEISLKTDDSGQFLQIQQGSRKYKLPTNDPEWFPPFAPFPEDNAVVWSGDFLQEVIDRISFCISDEDTMEAIACMNMVAKQKDDKTVVEVCGLNGHQFAMFSFDNPDIAEMVPESGILIQKKYLLELKRWLTENEIELAISEKRLFFRTVDGFETFSLPLSYYQYPDYNSFLTKVRGEGGSELKVDRAELAESLDRIMIFNSENNRCVNMHFDGDTVTLYSQGQDVGTASESMTVEFTGDLPKIAFPTKNLIEILSHFTSKTLSFKLTGAEGPCGISGDKDPDYMVIIMPMKIVEETYYTEEKA